MKHCLYLIILLGISLIFNTSIIAQNPVFAGGNGTSSNPYLIEDREQLDYVREFLGNEFRDVHFKLVNDINLTGEEWVPIGTDNYFYGKFDGNGKSIHNLNIGQGDDPVLYEYSGFFGVLGYSATIINLHIASGNIKGSDYSGGIAGYSHIESSSDTLRIINCSNAANILSDENSNIRFCGGIIGDCYAFSLDSRDIYIIINGCRNYGNISKGQSLGGIVGYTDNSMKITNCINFGELSDGYYIGGIVGYCVGYYSYDYGESHPYIEDCINYGNISDGYNIGGIIGRGYIYGQERAGSLYLNKVSNYSEISSSRENSSIGGIAGYLEVEGFMGGSEIIIENSFSCGILEVTSFNSNVGGIIGYGDAFAYGEGQEGIYSLTLKNSYSHSIIKVSGDNVNSGGIIGCIKAGCDGCTLNIYIETSYSAGEIISSGNQTNTGGLIGYAKAANGNISLKNLISAMTSISGTGNNTHRVIGNRISNITLYNNYANSAMLVNGDPIINGDLFSNEGENKTMEELQRKGTYTDYSDDFIWDMETNWTIRSDNHNLPYFRWQSSPVHVYVFHYNGLVLDVYTNSDSLQVYSLPGIDFETTVTNLIQGPTMYGISLPNCNVGDTVMLLNFEGNKNPSYPAFSKIINSYVPVEAHDRETGILVFPNPTPGQFNIDLGKIHKNVEVSIFDSMGKLTINNIFMEQQILNMDIKGSPGIYYMEIVTGSGNKNIFKIIKE